MCLTSRVHVELMQNFVVCALSLGCAFICTHEAVASIRCLMLSRLRRPLLEGLPTLPQPKLCDALLADVVVAETPKLSLTCFPWLILACPSQVYMSSGFVLVDVTCACAVCCLCIRGAESVPCLQARRPTSQCRRANVIALSHARRISWGISACACLALARAHAAACSEVEADFPYRFPP